MINVNKEPNARNAENAASLKAGGALSPSCAPIDAESLLKRCFGNVEFAELMLDELESTSIQRLHEVQQYSTHRDAIVTSELAHSLKGSAGVMCAEAMRKVACDLEHAGRTSDVHKIEAHISQLAEEINRCLAYLPELRRELKSVKERE